MNDYPYNIHNQQTIPFNDGAERALLGTFMMSKDAINNLPPTFGPHHFYIPINQALFEAALQCRDAGKRITPHTLISSLSPDFASKSIEGVPMVKYITSLMSDAISESTVADLAGAVMECYDRRITMDIGDGLSSIALRTSGELEFLTEIRKLERELAERIYEIQARSEPQDSFLDAVDKTFDATAEASAGRRVSGITTGIPALDNLIGPIGESDLIVLGGDVKTGKSALAWQCFFNMAEKYPVAGMSGEMPVSQIIMREKARRTGISAKRQRLGGVKGPELDELVRAGQEIKRLKHIDIIAKQITLEDIDERINRLHGEYGIKCFVVDHLLKLAWSGKMEDADDFKKANKATSSLKNIAMKRKVPIIGLTHINKNSNDGVWGKSYRDRLMAAKRKRPTYKSMLGNIDKDVDQMIIVHQAYPAVSGLEPEEGTEDYALWEATMAEVKGKAEFILALSRENEFPRRAEIQWNGECTSFGPSFKDAMNRRSLL